MREVVRREMEMVRAKGEELEVIITGDEGCQGRKGNAMNEHPQQNDDVTGGRVRMDYFLNRKPYGWS